MKQLDDTTRKYLWIGGFLVIGILSLTVGLFLYDKLITEMTVTYLDLKKKTVLELTAAATASSAAITMIPGDIGTPIADKLARFPGQVSCVHHRLYHPALSHSDRMHSCDRPSVPSPAGKMAYQGHYQENSRTCACDYNRDTGKCVHIKND